MLMKKQKVTLAKSQPVNSWNQRPIEAVKDRMRQQDVAYGQRKRRSTGQLKFLRQLK